MTARSDFVHALHELRDSILAVREEFGDKRIFCRNLTHFIKPGKSGRRLVELSLVSDCLRAFAYAHPLDDLHENVEEDLICLFVSIAAVKIEYAEFKEMRNGQLKKAFNYFRDDASPFGFHHEDSSWSGMETCANADSLSLKSTHLEAYRKILTNWLSDSDSTGEIMSLPTFGETYAKCKGPNVQLRPNVVCKDLQVGDDQSKRQKIRVPEITQRLAYWELLELTRENGLQFSSSLRDRQRLTPRQKLELEKFLDPGRHVSHLWPEQSADGFHPFPRTFATNPFGKVQLDPARSLENRTKPDFPERESPNAADEENLSEQTAPLQQSANVAITPVQTESKPHRPSVEIPAFTRDEEKNLIIDAPLDANHIVFAPPGTGKTYALVKRLAKLISEGRIDNPNKEVLILSFSRAAVAEIVKRMDEEAEDSENNNLRYVQIRTFDSFAARSMTMGASPVKLAGSYSKNIEMFCQLLSDRKLPEESLSQIDEIKLLVVDEIQDIVGERARMTLGLIQQVLANDGSVLLLGDPAQAIYDWQLRENDLMTSAEFISRSKSLVSAVGRGFEERTFEHYHRFENERLLDFVRACRRAIGDDGSHPDMTGLRNQLNSFGTTIPEERLSTESTSTHSVAVLTRTNLEAYQLSRWCDENAISHRVERGASGRFWPGWIARLCLGFEQSKMSKQMIERRWNKLVAENEMADLGTALEYLKNHGVYQDQNLDVDNLSALIEKSQPLTLWPPGDDCGMTISTVHRSKGLQFDRVAILEPGAGNFSGGDSSKDDENARVIYVAATRAKSELLRLTRSQAIFKKGFKRCSKRSWNKLMHFRLWNSNSKTNRFLLDGTDEFDLVDYMNTIKSSTFKDVHEAIWLSRSLSTKLEAVPVNNNWLWKINGKRLCSVSRDLENTLTTFNGFLGYHKTGIERLALAPIVDVASVSFAWRGDREVERVLGKPRLALIPVVYGLALVQQSPSSEVDELY